MYWPRKMQCDIKSSHRTLTIADVQGLFYLFSGCLFLSFIVFVMESGLKTLKIDWKRISNNFLPFNSEKKCTEGSRSNLKTPK